MTAAAVAAAVAGVGPSVVRAAIVIDPQAPAGASFRLFPFADGGGPDAAVDPTDDSRPPTSPFTSFVVPPRARPVSQTGRAGTATANAQGSTDTSFSIVNDALTLRSAASFNDDARFTAAAAPLGRGGASAGGDFRLGLNLLLSDRPYAYSYTWRSDSLQSDVVAGSRTEASLEFLGASAFSGAGTPRISGLSDLHAQQAASDTFQSAGAGVLEPRGALSVNLHLLAAAAAGSAPSLSPGTSHTEGSFDFKFDLTPGSRWINPSDGLFHTAPNWTGNFVPGSGEAAIFDVPGSYTVSLDRSVSNAAAHFHGDGTNVTVDVNGNTYTVGDIEVGGQAGDNVHVTFKDSGGIAVAALPGRARAAAADPPPVVTAPMAVRGGGTLDVLAPTGSDAVTVDQGGTANVAGSLAIWSAGSLVVGDAAAGTLSISNRGLLVTVSATLGNQSGGGTPRGVGTISVSDAAKWIAQETIVGNHGNGTIDVQPRGSIRVTTMRAGAELDGVGRINVGGASSDLSVDQLTVGDKGNGHLNVSNGGNVTVEDTLAVGDGPSGVGEVIVSGQGTHLTTETLDIGRRGSGTIAISNGALLSAGEKLSGRADVGPSSTLSVSGGGTFTAGTVLGVNGHLTLDRSSQAVVGDEAFSPVPVGPGQLMVAPGGILAGTGTITANLRLVGGHIGFTGGTLAPGHSPGTLTVEGDFTQERDSLMDMEIAGTSPGLFDVLAVVGDASVDGDLRLEFLDGFAPHRGDRFDFLTATGGLTGQFQNVDVRNLAPGFQFDLRLENGRYALVALNDAVFVPEPGTAAALVALTVTLLRRRRRRL